MSISRIDVHQLVTDKVVEGLKFAEKWERPWFGNTTSIPRNLYTGNKYNGMNILLLWLSAMEEGYQSNFWLSFGQAKKMGGYIKKGESGFPIIFYKTIVKTDPITGEESRIPVPRKFTVFNLDQVEGVALTEELMRQEHHHQDRYQQGIDFIQNYVDSGPKVKEAKGSNACYMLGLDQVLMPPYDHFKSTEHYLATYFHELGHSTAHPSRCNRDLSDYDTVKGVRAFEELVAELTALYICAELGFTETQQSHCSYIASWLRCLENDKKFIFKAMSEANKAVAYIQPKETLSTLGLVC